MRRCWRWGALALGTLAGVAGAQDEAPSLAAFLLRQTGSANSAQCHHIAHIARPQAHRHVGLIASCTDNADGSRQAWVFVADEAATGPIKLQVLSAPFDFGGSRHYVELVQAQGAQRFSIQINYRGGCGTSFDRFRIAFHQGDWVVAGLDSKSTNCGAPGEGTGSSRQERSADFLTGRVEERDYQHNKLVARRTHVDEFRRFALSDFDPFDPAYGPR